MTERRAPAAPQVVEVAAHYPPFLGGLEMVVQELAEGLAARGRTVQVVTGDRGTAPPRSTRPGTGGAGELSITRHRTFEVGGLTVIPGMLRSLARVAGPAVFHVHVTQAGIPEMALLVGWLRKVPVVLHFHLDVEPSGRFGWVFTQYKRRVLPKSLRRADRVVVFSAEQARLLGRKYGVGAERFAVVPNGIRPMERAVRDRSFAAPLRVLFVGRLAHQKRVGTLLRAVAKLGGEVQLRVVGAGPLEGELEQLARQLGLGDTTFDGSLAGEALVEAFRWADVFVLPSDVEGMPLALLEAMRAGLVAIGSDASGIRDFITHDVTGVLFPPGDDDRLAQLLKELSADAQRCARLAGAARQSVAHLSWDHSIDLLVGELDPLAGRSGGAGGKVPRSPQTPS